MVKFIFLRRPQNFAKSSPYFWLALHRTKVRWRFRKILWPSQNMYMNFKVANFSNVPWISKIAWLFLCITSTLWCLLWIIGNLIIKSILLGSMYLNAFKCYLPGLSLIISFLKCTYFMAIYHCLSFFEFLEIHSLETL